ncbi:HAD family hydrolase [Marinobacter sp. LN3S78]|uniref:HAD family hydrolase n=1 Tax=Marinobacter sp. LN3S78 TaxID=3382300 RepID=UPI00387AB4BA
MADLARYRTWVFDCDGVLLDSNRVKTEAFYRAAEPYGRDHAEALVDYHVRNGGISRYVKFSTFLSDIVGRSRVDTDELQQLLDRYAGLVGEGLRQCAVADGLMALRRLTGSARWLVVSGGDQEELRSVFADRGLAELFDGGIFGSPDTKDEILARERETGGILQPAVFIGDSRYDIEAATRAGLDFIFASRWSESDHDFSGSTLTVEGIDTLVEYLGQSPRPH